MGHPAIARGAHKYSSIYATDNDDEAGRTRVSKMLGCTSFLHPCQRRALRPEMCMDVDVYWLNIYYAAT